MIVRIWNVAGAALGARLNTRASFAPTRLIWNRGIALLCDFNGGLDVVRKQRGGGRPALRFDPASYAGIGDGSVVWVRSTALPQFVAEVLPNISARFALVTGDEDWSLPSGFARSHEILTHPGLACWFTQNYDGTDTSGKVFPLPIGIDFHTISNRHKWGHWQATPQQQERELERLVMRARPNQDRLARVHTSFHLSMSERLFSGQSRHMVQAILANNANVDFLHTKVSRLALWRETVRYAFVASPHGNGLDCHRTWEALALGCIPIVRRSSIDALYRGLPVVIVQNWEEITEENLRRWHDALGHQFDEPAVHKRLTNQWWMARIRRILTEPKIPSMPPPTWRAGVLERPDVETRM